MAATPGPGTGRPGRRMAGELEAEVLATLWAASRPLAPAEVHAELGAGVAYTTVTTILHRLHHKGLVDRCRSGRGYAYAPAADEATRTAQAMHALLRRGHDRAAVLARFLNDLSPADEQVLQDLLRQAEER